MFSTSKIEEFLKQLYLRKDVVNKIIFRKLIEIQRRLMVISKIVVKDFINAIGQLGF